MLSCSDMATGSRPQRPRCDYCYRPSIAAVLLANGPGRALLGRERRKRYVCAEHLLRATRPAGRHQ